MGEKCDWFYWMRKCFLQLQQQISEQQASVEWILIRGSELLVSIFMKTGENLLH